MLANIYQSVNDEVVFDFRAVENKHVDESADKCRGNTDEQADYIAIDGLLMCLSLKLVFGYIR